MIIALFTIGIILGILLLFALYVLLFPIQIILDSNKGIYWIGWNRWMYVKLNEKAEFLGIRVHFPFWIKNYELEDIILKNPKRPRKKKAKRKRLSSQKILRMLRQVRINEFKWYLDTDNYVLNAYLTPLFEFYRFRSGYATRINFLGKNELKVKARSRMINLLAKGLF